MSAKTSVPDRVNNTYEDLSGVSTKDYSNPYDALIAACEDDAVCLRRRYHKTHADS
jgi:vesicle-fusing ATPase